MNSRLDEARQAIRRIILDFLEQQGFHGLEELVRVEIPTERGHGDLTSSFALKVSSYTKMAPRALLERLIDTWVNQPAVERIEAAGPGFLNITLDTRWMAQLLPAVLNDVDHYGDSAIGEGQRILLEYVSANPTGPMVLVSGRAAAVGDTLARCLSASGFSVSREFYVNDAGNQITTLGHAVVLRLRELQGEDVLTDWPDGVYPGEYVKDLAQEYQRQHPEVQPQQLTEAMYPQIGQWAAEVIRKTHEDTLAQFGVTFDRWYSERFLREKGAPQEIIARLKDRGVLAEQDGALWFRSTLFGDDKDRVMVKSDGSFTYFVPDAAYHADKFDRGFDYVIDLLGPDHHGYVGRMRAVVQALGYPPERLEILIVQLVRLMRDGQLVRMSKRGGSFVELTDLIEEAGVDPARFFLLERAPQTPMDFDLNLATLRGSDNPVYYVQYAGARIHSILRQCQSLDTSDVPLDVSLLASEEERQLIFLIARFPSVIQRVALERAPQHLPKFLTELATAFHAFYRQHRILDAEAPLRVARIALIRAVLAVNTRGLSLMGISQPEVM